MANSAGPDDYYPVYITRSDGKGYQISEHNPLNMNEDKDVEQLERWEVIMAGHLKMQLAPKDDKRQFKLAALPKGYELRCAVRKDGGRDYYLYGHPFGQEYKYRTPGDFVLHLLWLVSDSNDHAQCSCDLCVRMIEARKQPSQAIPGTADWVSASTPGSGAGFTPGANGSRIAPRATSAQPPRPPAAGSDTGSTPGASGLRAAPAQPVQPPVAAGPPPAPPGMTGAANVFRVGELVWYKQTAWRLGLILGATPKGPNLPKGDGDYTFALTPLGHILLGQQVVTKEAFDMRPFLTFSVPNITLEGLQDKSFEAVNWQALVTQNNQESEPSKSSMRMQLLGLEASKMAARMINDSFSFFNKLNEGTTPDGMKVKSYTGLYLGAEMIHLHDPIRVTPPATGDDAPKDFTAVMLVVEIQLVLSANDPNVSPNIRFIGNIYRIVRAPLPHPPNFVAASDLGPAFEKELADRNTIERDKTMGWGWMLIEEDAMRTESEVQGRFYVTYELMKIIDPGRLQDSTQRGVVEEAQAYLNSRSHSGNGRSMGLKPGRAATVGNAVATPFVAPDGMVEN